MNYVYILHSKSVDKFYIGETKDLVAKLLQHNNHSFRSASTKIANDWIIVWSIECLDRSQARKIEAFIKKMKSRVYLEKLLNNTYTREYFLERFPC